MEGSKDSNENSLSTFALYTIFLELLGHFTTTYISHIYEGTVKEKIQQRIRTRFWQAGADVFCGHCYICTISYPKKRN